MTGNLSLTAQVFLASLIVFNLNFSSHKEANQDNLIINTVTGNLSLSAQICLPSLVILNLNFRCTDDRRDNLTIDTGASGNAR